VSNVNRWSRSRTPQTGATLMEVLTAIAILGVGIAAVVFATVGALRGGELARQRSELNSLSTSFGESIKGLPYFVCATPTDYQNSFVKAESLSPAAVRLQGKLGATLSVTDVADNAPGTRVCPGGDSGTQLVTLDVVAGDMHQTVKVVKRTPDPKASPATIDFTYDGPHLGVGHEHYPPSVGGPRTGLNNPIVQFGMVPRVVSTPGVALYEWFCFNPDDPADEWMKEINTESGGFVTSAAPRAADYATNSSSDPLATCAHDKGDGSYKAIQAPVNSEGYTWIGLRVTERSGVTYPVFVKKAWLPPSTYSLPKPVAVVTQLTTPGCVLGDPCSTTADVRFDGTGSRAGDGRHLIKCSWTFNDGSDPEVFVGDTCADPANVISHRFGEQRTDYRITLTVTDDAGQTASAFKELVVTGPPRPRPLVKIKASVDGGTTWSADRQSVYGIQRLRVTFSAAGSAATGGASITGYSWTFGDASSATGLTTSHDYEYPSAVATCNGVVGSFPVTVTVSQSHSDGWTASATGTLCVEVAQLAPPPMFSFARATPYFIWDWFNSETGIDLYFQWTPIDPTSSDRSNQVQVLLSSSHGFVCTIGDRQLTLDRDVAPLQGGALWQGASRIRGLGAIFDLGWNGVWQSVSHSCLYQVRTVRTDYMGNVFESPWSAPAQFPGFFG